MISNNIEFEFELPWEGLLKKDVKSNECLPVFDRSKVNYEEEKDKYDRLELFKNDVSDYKYINHTFEYYKYRGSDLASFLQEFDITNLYNRNIKSILNEYEQNCNLIKKNHNKFHQLKKEIKKGKILKGKEKKLFGAYLKWRFMVQRTFHFNEYYLENKYDLPKIDY